MRPVRNEIVARRFGVMTSEKSGYVELDEEMFSFDVSDEALKRAAAVTCQQAITIGACTSWWHCSWPM